MTLRHLLIALACSLLTLTVLRAGEIVEAPISEDQARVELTRALRDDQRITEAIAGYRALIEKMPARADLRIELAELYCATGDPDAAEKIIEPLDRSSFDKKGRLLLANLAVERKRYDEALAILRSLVDSAPNDAKLRFQLAETLSWAKRYDDSIAEFGRLVKDHPNDIQLRRYYARVLGWAGRPKDAIREWELSLKPQS